MSFQLAWPAWNPKKLDSSRPAYFGVVGAGVGGGAGENPFAITTAPLLCAAIMVFNPIAPTSMPRARATAPNLRDMEVPPRAGNTNGDTLSSNRIVSSRAHFDLVHNCQQRSTPAFAWASPQTQKRRLLPEGTIAFQNG